MIDKASPDEDFYADYSTTVDSVVGFGTRAEYLQEGTDERRLDRADETGSSGFMPFAHPWTAETIMMREGVRGGPDTAHAFLCKRDKLRAFCETLGDDGYFHPTADMGEWWAPEDDEDRIRGTRAPDATGPAGLATQKEA